MSSIENETVAATSPRGNPAANDSDKGTPAKPIRRWRSLVEIVEAGDTCQYHVGYDRPELRLIPCSPRHDTSGDPCLLCGSDGQGDNPDVPCAELVEDRDARWPVCLGCALSDHSILRGRAIARMDQCLAGMAKDWQSARASDYDANDVDAVSDSWSHDLKGLSRFLARGFTVYHTDAKRIVRFVAPDVVERVEAKERAARKADHENLVSDLFQMMETEKKAEAEA